jgi:voltage-gated potassium channel
MPRRGGRSVPRRHYRTQDAPPAVTPISHSALPYPAELDRGQVRPLARRMRSTMGALRHSGWLRFAALLLALVITGTVLMHLLEGDWHGSPFTSLFNDFWFTMVTITTVGYGDITPTHPLGRIVAITEMLVGVGLVGGITGAIASALVEANRRRALGLAPIRYVGDHIVVCGWKRDMRNILLGILQANRSLTSWDLVLVTTHPPNEIGDLRRERRLSRLHYIYGSHTERSVLEMAQVRNAQRVIILADETGRGRGADPDARTVLAATAVEAITSQVYTCTEIIEPHFVEYLRPAGVEEVVMEAHNARALIVSASLGDGLANVMTHFLPEQGQLRVLAVPAALVGVAYAELATRARERGYLPLGLLLNTGSLYERKHERIDEALRVTGYREAVETLHLAAHLVSNVPVLAPPPALAVPAHAKLIVLLPAGEHQAEEQLRRRHEQRTVQRPRAPERLVVCGWKHGMADLLLAMLQRHAQARRPLESIAVAARLPAGEADAIARSGELAHVRLVPGDPTDPGVLRNVGVRTATRVLVMADPVPEGSTQEADSRNVMVSIAVNDLNPAAYKCVEILNPSFGEYLSVANVEEPVHTGQYQRLMLVQASLGTGLASALGALVDPEGARLRVVDFPIAPPGTSFAEHAQALAAQGLLLIGSMEHSGNSHIRKTEYVRQAQVQSGVRGAVQHLLRLKSVQTNAPLLNPEPTFLPGIHSRALVIAQPPAAEPDAPGATPTPGASQP